MTYLPQRLPFRPTRAYTLIEALVASALLLTGIAAAASLSLALVTQEEIGERSERAYTYLENAALLYQAGVPQNEIPALLPPEPVVTSLDFTAGSLEVSDFGPLPSITLTVQWNPAGATATAGLGRWTGGATATSRRASIDLIRTNPTVPAPLPRVDAFD